MTENEVAKTKEGRGSRRRNRSVATNNQPKPENREKDRATPSSREVNKRGGNIITRFFGNVRDYITSTLAELRKVTWPSRQDTIRLSAIVLIVTIVFSIALGLLDWGYGELFRLGFTNPLIFVGFAVVLALAVGVITLNTRRGRSL